MKLAANLTMLFSEVPFWDRFKAARMAGFEYVEILFPFDYDKERIARSLEDNNLNLVLFDFPPGDWAKGDRGIASDPQRVKEFRESVETSMEWAKKFNTKKLNCLAGKKIPGLTRDKQWEQLQENLHYAATALKKENIDLLVEPINFYDVLCYFLHNCFDAIRLIEEISMDNVFLQFDAYHIERIHSNTGAFLQQYLKKTGHIQIADCPGRHQPGTGTMNYDALLELIDASDYFGYVSLEYIPKEDTLSSLDWFKERKYI